MNLKDFKLDAPSFAQRFDYLWHSNPKSKPRSKTIFDKVHIRPIVSKAWEEIKDADTPQTARILSEKIVNHLDSSRNGSDNANMACGRAVQTACDKILIDNFEPARAYDEARDQLSQFKPRWWDDGIDEKKFEKYSDVEFEAVINTATEGLREAMSKDNTIIGETDYIRKWPGLDIPYNTKPDYNRRGALKTKWSRISTTSKSGFSAASLPKNLNGPFEQSALYQVAGFWACNGKLPPFLVYANANDYRIFNQDNCEELQDENLERIVKNATRILKVTEKHLKNANTKQDLFDGIDIDFNDIAWNEPPTLIKEAKKVWGITW